jgi:hypothetical protein
MLHCLVYASILTKIYSVILHWKIGLLNIKMITLNDNNNS